MKNVASKVFVILFLGCCLLSTNIGLAQEYDYSSTVDYYRALDDQIASFEDYVEANDYGYYVMDGVLFRGDILCAYPSNKKGETYHIPDGTKAVYYHAFSDVEFLKELHVPSSCSELAYFDSDKEICDSLLASDSFSDITAFFVEEGNTAYSSQEGVLFSANKETLYIFPDRAQKEYSIPEGTKHIADCAFYCAQPLENVIFPSSLTTIGESSFTSIHIGSVDLAHTRVESIGMYAFEGSLLTSVSLPNTIKMIAAGAFSQNNLQEITLPEGLSILDTYAFWGSEIEKIHLPSSLEFIGEDICVFGDENGEPAIPIYSAEEGTYAYNWIHQEELKWK